MAFFGTQNKPAPLTPEEREYLAKLVAVVSAGIKSFCQAGRALTLIRDRQLYRETHATFEEFVSAQWQMSRSTRCDLSKPRRWSRI